MTWTLPWTHDLHPCHNVNAGDGRVSVSSRKLEWHLYKSIWASIKETLCHLKSVLSRINSKYWHLRPDFYSENVSWSTGNLRILSLKQQFGHSESHNAFKQTEMSPARLWSGRHLSSWPRQVDAYLESSHLLSLNNPERGQQLSSSYFINNPSRPLKERKIIFVTLSAGKCF